MDVYNLCRSCMEEVASWESENLNQNTIEMFRFCTNIEIFNEDTLPKHFCHNCTILLESFYTYIRKARRVNSKLKKLAKSSCEKIVDNFLSQKSLNGENSNENVDLNNFCKSEKITVDAVKIDVNEYDRDMFDENDDICLSEIKSEKLENEIKSEPQIFQDSDLVKEEEDLTDTNCKSSKKPSKSKNKYGKKCSDCEKVFNKKGWLSRHMKVAHIDKELPEKENESVIEKRDQKETKVTDDPTNEIKCRVCQKVFSSKWQRAKHLNEQHAQSTEGHRVFLCPYCPKTFSKYSHMYYHTKSHPDLKKHPCKTCGKEYQIRQELDQHMRTHLRDRPYACDKCDMRFKMRGNLVIHMKQHDGVKPYLCSICGRRFIQCKVGHLESHMRVHTGEKPFACSQCAFRSTSRVSLTRHVRIHSGERPFPCSYCPKRFYDSSSLTRHVRCHTRERPYRCPYCSRYFNDSGKRRRHFMRTHKMAPEEIPPMDKDGAPIERTEQNSMRKRVIKQE